MQSGLPADAASLRETGSVDRYTQRGPVSHRIAAVQCLVSLILSLMAPRVCTLVLSSYTRQKKPSAATSKKVEQICLKKKEKVYNDDNIVL